MALPDDDNTPKKKTPTALETVTAERDAALAEIARRDRALEREKDLQAAREKDRADARAAKTAAHEQGVAPPPPKLLGQIPVYLDDEPADVLERAKALFAGSIPTDRARRFRVEARLRFSPRWGDGSVNKLHQRHGGEPPLRIEFDADEMPLVERQGYAAQGAIVAIA
jgi:hypothetical protein